MVECLTASQEVAGSIPPLFVVSDKSICKTNTLSLERLTLRLGGYRGETSHQHITDPPPSCTSNRFAALLPDLHATLRPHPLSASLRWHTLTVSPGTYEGWWCYSDAVTHIVVYASKKSQCIIDTVLRLAGKQICSGAVWVTGGEMLGLCQDDPDCPWEREMER